jgi:hypothetical protein
MENFKNELIQFAKWSDKQRFDELEESDNAYEKLVDDYFLYRWVGENSVSQHVSDTVCVHCGYTIDKHSPVTKLCPDRFAHFKRNKQTGR